MTLKDAICEAVAEYARENGYISDTDVVLDFEEETRDRGFCETCSYEETVITLTLTDHNTVTLYTTLDDLVRSF